MISRASDLLRTGATACVLVCLSQSALAQQLNENCTVSVLNRNVRVRADGSWVLPNIPANFGPVRARVTCVIDGRTVSGESEPFVVPVNGAVNIPRILFGQTTPIPTAVTITAPTHTLRQAGATVQVTTSARYADATVKDVTAAAAGTQYTISNVDIAKITGDGLVTAIKSGTVLVQATHEGASGLTSLQVLLSGGSHGGIPDSWAMANGLNPDDPTMPFQDPDRDGLTNQQEFQAGTDPRSPDTDGDGLTDGDEVARGTSPLLRDTDGDGISDALEVQTGSDPLNSNSVNLAGALTSLDVAPGDFTLSFNTIAGDVFQQLKVTGTLRDGTAIDLTSTARGTNYATSDVTVCSFGGINGRIFAGRSGLCTVTVTAGGFTAGSTGMVRTFSPSPLSFVSIPGFANNVDVNGDSAYVAAGAAGLQVVDVSDRSAPRRIAALDLAGNANDVKLAGGRAYVAAGSAGLHIVDVSNPSAPHLFGSADTPGDAYDVAVSGTLVFVADGPGGLQIIDATNPASPRVISSLHTPGTAKGVDVSGDLAVVADGTGGVEIIDVSNPLAPAIVGHVDTPADARDVAVSGRMAYIADYTGSLQVVDFSIPTAPTIVGTTPPALGGFLMDVGVSGSFVLGADVFFVNGVPIVDVSAPNNPLPRAILDFRNLRDDNGTGIAVDGSYVYLTASRGIVENGTSEDTRLYIGQYRALEDLGGVAPTARIASPAPGATFVEGEAIPITVDATDDVAVTSVSFVVGGTVRFSDTAAPYQFTVVAPAGAAGLMLGATAVDLAGNLGLAANILVNVIPDPGTTVVGRVIGRDGAAVSGASINCLAISGVSAGDGSFAIAGVPTVQPAVACSASLVTPDGARLAGATAAVAPVRGGTTNAGTVVVGAAFTAPPAGLVSWWPGEGDARDIAGQRSGTLENGVTFGPGKFGQAFMFDGANNVVRAPDGGLPLGSAPRTLEFWMKPVANARVPVIYGGFQANDAFYVIVTGSTACIGQFGGGDVCGSQTVADDRWHHVAMTYDGALVRLYVDSVLDAATPKTYATTRRGTVYIGSTVEGSGEYYRGGIDEVRIYGRALSSAEIRSLVNPGPVTFDAGADFTTVSNPNGPWTYGATTTLGTIVAYGVSDTSQWHLAPGIPESLGAPTIWENQSGTYSCGFVCPPHQLIFHPGPNSIGVIRWTAPAAGTYGLNVAFTGGDTATTDVHVLRGSSQLFVADINGRGDAQSFSTTLTLATGETIDFAVGDGHNYFYSDSTFIDATITAVEAGPPAVVTYYGFNPTDEGRLTLVGSNSAFKLYDLDAGGALVATGVVGAADVRGHRMDRVRHFKLETSAPVAATLGFDCCGFGGSTFYPATDAKLVGRAFALSLRVLADNNEFIIFAFEASDITIRDRNGTVVLTRTLAANGFYATIGAPLAAGSVYRVESTGNISIQSSARNGNTAVPSSTGSDVGTVFLFGTRSWQPSAVALFAYEDAVVTGFNLEAGAVAFSRTLLAGQFAYVSGFGDTKFKVTSTGKIGVWAGSPQVSDRIDDLGDDLTMNTGDDGLNLYIHTQSLGAVVFAFDDGTVVSVDGSPTLLDTGQFLSLAPGAFRHITSNKPVVVQTMSNGLDDWETELVPRPGRSPK